MQSNADGGDDEITTCVLVQNGIRSGEKWARHLAPGQEESLEGVVIKLVSLFDRGCFACFGKLEVKYIARVGGGCCRYRKLLYTNTNSTGTETCLGKLSNSMDVSLKSPPPSSKCLTHGTIWFNSCSYKYIA
jgi:hypothetical protein